MLVVAIALPTLLAKSEFSLAQEPKYTNTFRFEQCRGFSSTGRNPFFVLEPGFQQVLAGKDEGVDVRLTITVLHQTKKINGVTTRIVEEVETKNGKLFEIARNYFAICNRDNSVVYFGEDVSFYNNGVVVSNQGSWLAGIKNARPGIIMPGTVLLGARYFQEIAPGVALDRAEIVSINEVVYTPARIFQNSFKTEETTPLDPSVKEFKWYAPGIGLIRDGVLKLVQSSPIKSEDNED
ncbi:hypothetical protein C7B64_03400 [Merismopedia glauca CCAP 1448/3]|uniref:Uncharacterized protein n=1 Tax=Merismopedia glauca CCAP 1448/3 TaxID=1296344 RepID=A0A2T1C8M8_9CYAN|nr:hypothetical protein C7B64_03400 [Merismopedia glauca CCAP 1448/3]